MEGIAGELTLPEETHAYDESDSVPRGPGVDQLAHVPPRVVVPESCKVLGNLTQLELHNGRIWVTIAVIFCHDGNGFFAAVLAEEPARRLGEEHDHYCYDTGENALNECGEAPGPGGVGHVVVGAVLRGVLASSSVSEH